ncbi:MAG: tripartite tricarboxylate transporter substrate binding protein, partial [Acidobacteria bacterium]|nr:tripartite tricarboxylate transporter substrate binding protein [Acidobacteriota bacterium]
HSETVKVLQSPEIQAKLSSFGADPLLMQPTEFDTYVRNEITANETLVKAAGLAAK